MIVGYILLLICVVSLIIWPYERIAFKRILTVHRIARICDKRGIKFRVLNRAYFLSSNQSNKFDFILRIEKTVIPVKFFSAVDKNATIILSQSGKISKRSKVRDPFGRGKNKNYRSIEKTSELPYMRIEKKIIGERFKSFPIFLNEPSFETIFFMDDKGEISEFYDVSKQVAGCNFVDGKTFEELLTLYTER